MNFKNGAEFHSHVPLSIHDVMVLLTFSSIVDGNHLLIQHHLQNQPYSHFIALNLLPLLFSVASITFGYGIIG